jgi:hypothetical protein
MYAKRRFILPGLMALALLATLALALPVAAQEPCIGDPECYEPPPAPPPSGRSTSPASSGPAAPPWSGFSDGRLNPHQAEYYTLYCKNTFLEIWRGAPTGSLLQFVPIWLLDGLSPNGGTTTIPNYGQTPFTITRWGDSITVSGNYGNFQPAEGEKIFNLSECISRNDGPIGSAPPGYTTPGLFDSVLAVTLCYGRDSEVVRRGLVPPDQICDEGPTRVAVG